MNATIDNRSRSNCWIEIDSRAFQWNLTSFRTLAGPDRLLMAVVKANAYGHGMLEIARLAIGAGAEWLGVFSVEEGLDLRTAGIDAPVLVLGPPGGQGRIADALDASLRLSVPSLHAAEEIARLKRSGAIVHLELETGTNRQGLDETEIKDALKVLLDSKAVIEGAYTHFADIEDTTDHAFAEFQLGRFMEQIERLSASGTKIALPHAACSAATILFPSTYFQMVRVGIALYGLWPSRETLVSAKSLGRNALELRPVMAMKTRIAQIKCLGSGEFVSYGRTFRTTRPTKIAVLPVGYADGYDRRLSNTANAIVRGVRAPVRGRICMNMTMVDVTDIPAAAPGDEVVLLGRQEEETVSAEDLARLAGTINYEIVTRLAPNAPRIVI
jgi:alanine racemase